MKLSNPIANMRNFMRSNHAEPAYTHYQSEYDRSYEQTSSGSQSLNLFLPMQDKSLLLRPLSDTHLVEVYHEAKAMRLSNEFISLIEQAIEQRGLEVSEQA
ncbi:sporulation histidine kinase inhibitor Sda [Paenibacillus sp. GCM10027626]|uniref:sporulation histidine kinase inhibitor Sda n=1 Tax=Paenibacillus sp. GCM10027626 TaxID=3273411 RepID=UPI0036294DAF